MKKKLPLGCLALVAVLFVAAFFLDGGDRLRDRDPSAAPDWVDALDRGLVTRRALRMTELSRGGCDSSGELLEVAEGEDCLARLQPAPGSVRAFEVELEAGGRAAVRLEQGSTLPQKAILGPLAPRRRFCAFSGAGDLAFECLEGEAGRCRLEISPAKPSGCKAS